MKQALLEIANAPLRLLGLRLIPSWRLQWWTNPPTFRFGGREFYYFYHPYNCGWPPYVSERTVELALANVWLGTVSAGEVVEVGAVTPYYWPGRVHTIIDPYDPHEKVTLRKSVLDTSLEGRAVLSISTFEHIGSGDYGLEESPGHLKDALKKLFAESTQFLVTVPAGCNPVLDEFIWQDRPFPQDVSVRFLVRETETTWQEAIGLERDQVTFGAPGLQRRFPGTCIGRWANCVVVLERGGLI